MALFVMPQPGALYAISDVLGMTEIHSNNVQAVCFVTGHGIGRDMDGIAADIVLCVDFVRAATKCPGSALMGYQDTGPGVRKFLEDSKAWIRDR